MNFVMWHGVLLSFALIGLIASCNEDVAKEPVPLSRLTFVPRRSTGEYDVRLPTTDFRRPVDLSRSVPPDTAPAWSPDGSSLAFYSDRKFNLPDRDDNLDIYTMAADGSSFARLTDTPSVDAFPSWSPDGSRLLFYSERSGNGDVYVMNADGSGVIQLTQDRGVDIPHSWSPDGMRILFSSARDGDLDLYAMNTEGSEVDRLTNNDQHDLSPAWSLDGTRIAY